MQNLWRNGLVRMSNVHVSHKPMCESGKGTCASYTSCVSGGTCIWTIAKQGMETKSEVHVHVAPCCTLACIPRVNTHMYSHVYKAWIICRAMFTPIPNSQDWVRCELDVCLSS